MPTRPPTPPTYDVFDDEFRTLIDPDAELRHLGDGYRWAEGPVYLADSDTLLWSDIPNDRRMRLDAATGTVSVADRPANFSNGHTLDREGRVVACEHGTRSVARFEPDGSRTVLADRFDGKRFNSPNDVVVASDGSVWFTDPTYGIDSDVEGRAAVSEIGSNNVYRIDVTTGAVTAEIADMVQPNGLAFSLDEVSLYVADTGVSHLENGPRHIRRYDVLHGRVTGGGEVFAVCPEGVFDGFRLDDDGRIWASGRQGVHCYRSDGLLLGTIRLPEVCANLVFGGADRGTLYMTANTSLYSLTVRANGTSAG
jgi:gluconolactonase